MLISTFIVLSTVSFTQVFPVYYNVGVLMTTKLNSPFDLERCGPAVDLALRDVNERFLKLHKVQLQKVQAR